MTSARSYTVLLASYLEPEHVERIRAVDTRLNVIYAPELVAPPRFPADHSGGSWRRTPKQEARWRDLLRQADIIFDFDFGNRQELPDLVPQVLWIQATCAGIGEFIQRRGYAVRLPHTVFTTAGGVHARPLAEFCLMAMLMHAKGALHMMREQRARHWERYAGTDLEGRTVALVGLGNLGAAVARLARAFGMPVLGTSRTGRGADQVDRYFPFARLHEMLPLAEYLVVAVPHTPATEGMIGAAELALLPPDAFFINIARGRVVDEPSLIAALQSGRLGGAALDVFASEPLPDESPLWRMPNVLVSPHSASNSDRENARLTDLFCDNLRRFLDGRPLRNVLDVARLY